jgi:hypothetical protein
MIEAMKQALEALTAIDGAMPFPVGKSAIKALEEALAKQEQGEPVTWRNAAIRVGEDLCSVGPFGYYDMTAEQWLDWALSVVTVHLPPQQRTWVDLTDEDEIPWDGVDAKSFAKAIEAKLKEKNSYAEEKNT